MNRITIFSAALIIGLSACKKDKEDVPTPEVKKNDIPEFYQESSEANWGKTAPEIVKISESSSRISDPTDLDFNPTRPGELWIVNQGTEGTGGSTVMVTGLNSSSPSYDYRKDQNSWHFMSLPTGIAFGDNGNFATSTGVLDANHNGGTFTGPALWSSDLNVYARPSGGNGSHLDMLHASPYSMGIAWETGNAYWVMDGYHGNICRYDFVNDHGPGNSDHDDGRVRRYTNVKVKKNLNIPSHMEFDHANNNLYAVDNGNNRVLKIEVSTQSKIGNLTLINEQLAEYSEMNADFKVISSNALTSYCGLAMNGNRIFLSDYETGTIICLNSENTYEIGRIETGIKGITGIVVDANNVLWFVSNETDALYKVVSK
ncbi:MAG: hypothetical protein ACI8ZN_001859 [Bacteroidia bacterium]|jgi:hypothetical protein